MKTAERRNEIIRILCRKRHETVNNLASQLAVSERTIRRDIDVLSIHYPIYTQTGRYTGGIYIMDGFSMDRMYMNSFELDVLKKLYEYTQINQALLNEEERKALYTIISTYSKKKQ